MSAMAGKWERKLLVLSSEEHVHVQVSKSATVMCSVVISSTSEKFKSGIKGCLCYETYCIDDKSNSK